VHEWPFQLSVKRDDPQRTEVLLCTALLRDVPGKRAVYRAQWNRQDVVVKVFSHKIHAARHLKREWRGLLGLRQRGFSAPQPLFHGKTTQGRRVLVMENIGDAPSVRRQFAEVCEPAPMVRLLEPVCRELARYHEKGVLQTDLHLGNFLAPGDGIVAIDAAQIRFRAQPIRKRESLAQLAELASFLPPSCSSSLKSLYEEYFKTRRWSLQTSDETWLRKKAQRCKSRAIDRVLRKYRRSNSRHSSITVPGYRGLFDRLFCRGGDANELVTQLDALMETADVLKRGNTCFVSRLRWNGRDIVVKRYNHKGLIHSLRHTIKKSRARHGWIASHRLRLLGIGTPEPLAYIERRRGPIVWCSYLIHEYVPGRKLNDLLQDDTVSPDQRQQHIAQVLAVLEKLGRYRITHGDMKHSNILIGAGGPILTDLDALTVHRWRRAYEIGHRKDVRRFQVACEAGTWAAT